MENRGAMKLGSALKVVGLLLVSWLVLEVGAYALLGWEMDGIIAARRADGALLELANSKRTRVTFSPPIPANAAELYERLLESPPGPVASRLALLREASSAPSCAAFFKAPGELELEELLRDAETVRKDDPAGALEAFLGITRLAIESSRSRPEQLEQCEAPLVRATRVSLLRACDARALARAEAVARDLDGLVPTGTELARWPGVRFARPMRCAGPAYSFSRRLSDWQSVRAYDRSLADRELQLAPAEDLAKASPAALAALDAAHPIRAVRARLALLAAACALERGRLETGHWPASVSLPTDPFAAPATIQRLDGPDGAVTLAAARTGPRPLRVVLPLPGSTPPGGATAR